jgi:hypothetical protein
MPHAPIIIINKRSRPSLLYSPMLYQMKDVPFETAETKVSQSNISICCSRYYSKSGMHRIRMTLPSLVMLRHARILPWK